MIWFLILVILSFNTVLATETKEKPKPIEDYKISIPEIKSQTLKNGFKLNILERKEYPFILINLYIRGGNSSDINQSRIANISSQVYTTALQKSNKLGKFILNNSLTINAETTNDYIAIEFKFLKKNLKSFLPLIAESITKPEINNDLIKSIIAERKSQAENMDERTLVINLSNNIIFGFNHNYSFKPFDANIINLTDVKNYLDKYFVPNNSTIIIQGDFKTKDMIKQIENLFQNWKKSADININMEEQKALPKGIHFIQKPIKSDKTNLYFIFNAPAKTDFDYEILKITLNMLTAEPNGFLTKELRKSIKSFDWIDSYISDNLFNNLALIGIRCNNDDIEKTMQLVKENIKTISKKIPEIEDLTSSQKYLGGKITLSFDNPSTVSELIYSSNLINTSIDYYKQLPRKLRNESPISILKVIQKYLATDIHWNIVLGDAELANKLERYHNLFLYDNKLNPLNSMWGRFEKYSISTERLINRYKDKISKDLGKLIALEKHGIVKMYNYDSPSSEGIIKIRYQSPDKMYQKIEINGMEQELWVNGSKSWVNLGYSIEEETDKINESSILMSKIFPIASLIELGYKCDVLGVQGNNIVLKAQSPLGRILLYYFDKDTYLLTRTDTYVENNLNSFVITTEFSDYSDIQGFMFPNTVIEKSPYFTMRYEFNYIINPEFSETTFLPASSDN